MTFSGVCGIIRALHGGAVLDLTFTQMVAAIFAGNVMTAAFLVAFQHSNRQKYGEHSWLVLAGLALPLVFTLLALATAVGPPPFLAALVSQ